MPIVIPLSDKMENSIIITFVLILYLDSKAIVLVVFPAFKTSSGFVHNDTSSNLDAHNRIVSKCLTIDN
jgi:hypothetical protein